MKTIDLICPFCNKTFTCNHGRTKTQRKNPITCSHSCALNYSNRQRGYGPEKLKYSKYSDLASLELQVTELNNKLQVNSQLFYYYLGLIASDGNISKTTNSVSFSSTDRELADIVNNFYKSSFTGFCNKIFIRDQYRQNLYTVGVASPALKKILHNIGITPNKSKTISNLNIPREYFFHFLRGLIDGDGCWHQFTQYNSIAFSLASASKEFLEYIKTELITFGFSTVKVHKSSPIFRLDLSRKEYSKLVICLYDGADYFLSRKKEKAELAKLMYIKYLDLNNWVNKSGFRGVGKAFPAAPNWRIIIKIFGKTFRKQIPSKEEAAKVYDRLSLLAFGDNAQLNFPENRAEYLKEDLMQFYEDIKKYKPRQPMFWI